MRWAAIRCSCLVVNLHQKPSPRDLQALPTPVDRLSASLFLQVSDAILETQRLQYPRRCFFDGERLVARVAVLRNSYLLIGRRVRSVMAAEAAREVGMAEIVGIRAPCDLQVRKYIPVVDRRDLAAGICDVLGAWGCNVRIALLIEIG